MILAHHPPGASPHSRSSAVRCCRCRRGWGRTAPPALRRTACRPPGWAAATCSCRRRPPRISWPTSPLHLGKPKKIHIIITYRDGTERTGTYHRRPGRTRTGEQNNRNIYTREDLKCMLRNVRGPRKVPKCHQEEKKWFYSCYLIQNTYHTDCDDAENMNFYECD